LVKLREKRKIDGKDRDHKRRGGLRGGAYNDDSLLTDRNGRTSRIRWINCEITTVNVNN
jgi:hypothetical protein